MHTIFVGWLCWFSHESLFILNHRHTIFHNDGYHQFYVLISDESNYNKYKYSFNILFCFGVLLSTVPADFLVQFCIYWVTHWHYAIVAEKTT